MSSTAVPTPSLLSVVGLGPGDPGLLAPEAMGCLKASRTVVGYSGYISLLDPELLRGKHIISTGMREEVQRVDAALSSALGGQRTCVVCSGDPGIYAMAGLVYERRERLGAPVPVEVVPGIPALCSAAALLGAPLMHDFACVSLSDLLTPWETIVRRLDCALAGDFVLVLYNPRSRRRTRQLEEALALALSHRQGSTPVGIVRNARRQGQICAIVPLDRVDPEKVDMLSLLIIGNTSSHVISGSGETPWDWQGGARMLTPRGYDSKY